ncbi:MAG: MFS transporter [Betaproteobacteria bacterium]|nr:MFS transporter [Betaproteobacteria bacterium]
MSLAGTSSSFAPFRVRAFRFQWPSDLLVSFALEMETLILGWYILIETESVVLLTAFAGLQFLGALVAPYVGVLGDRLGRRRILHVLRMAFGCLAAALMLLGFSGNLSPVAVFAVAFLAGLLRPSDLMLRLALVTDMMPGDRLMAAMGLSRMSLDMARVFGALAGAGLFAWLGFAVSYIFVAGFYFASFALMFSATIGRSAPGRTASGGAGPAPTPPRAASGHDPERAVAASKQPGQSAWRDLKDGLAYVRDTPRLLAIFWLAVLINLVGFPLTAGLLPYVAREIYLLDEIGYGHLVAAHALGALTGSVMMTFIIRATRAARNMLGAAVLWHAVIVAFALIEGSVTGMALLFLVGVFQSITMVALSAALLGAAAPAFRARVMGVRMLAVYGLPLGLLAAGYLIKLVGFVPTMAMYGAIGLAGSVIVGRRWRSALWA